VRHSRSVFASPLALLATLSLVAATAAALPAPAQAVDGVIVTQSTPIHLGEPEYFNSGPAMAVAAGGAADVYPSTIDLPDDIGAVTDVNVTINDPVTDNLESLHLLLVAPDGRRALLLGHAGGANSHPNGSLTLDDEQPAVIPDDSPPGTSLVRPSVYASPAAPPAPAPTLTGDTALSTFDGSLATGEWRLYLYDDGGEAVSISGWALFLELRATPYPSALDVPAIPGAVVTDVDVSLHLTSDSPDGAFLLLVGPQGQHTVLMEDTGWNHPVSNVAITLDDEATSLLPDDDQIVAGSYRPSAFGTPGNYPYPAPAPTPEGTPALSVFDGTAPQGTWQLFAQDPFEGDLTTVQDWTLDIEYVEKTSPSGSVGIAGGTAGTRTPAVVLNLSATDPQPGSGISDVRLSNDGVTFSAFQFYAATLPWTLTPGDGTKTVYAQFRDADGNLSPVVSDTIVLDTTAPTVRKLRPKQGADGVARGATVKMWATEALEQATVTKASVSLKTDGHKVRVKVTYDAVRRLVRIDPKGKLEPGRYVVKIRTSVTDTVGNRLDAKAKAGAQPVRWSFRV